MLHTHGSSVSEVTHLQSQPAKDDPGVPQYLLLNESHSPNPYFSKSTYICFICQLFYSCFIKGNKSVHHRLVQMKAVHPSRPQFYNNKVGVMPGTFCLTDPRPTPPPLPCLSHTHKCIYTHVLLKKKNWQKLKRCPNS